MQKVHGNASNANRVGTKHETKYGRKIEVISYKNRENVVVKFECGLEKEVSWDSIQSKTIKHPDDYKTKKKSKTQHQIERETKEEQFKSLIDQGLTYREIGNIMNMTQDTASSWGKKLNYRSKNGASPLADRVGETNFNRDGRRMTIVEYINRHKYKVKFDSGFEAWHTDISNFTTGNIKDWNMPTVSGIGYMSDGKYSKSSHSNIYNVWKSMIHRCYNPENPNYKTYGARGCTVCPEWHNFQNYAKWYEDNYVSGWHVDKDLIEIENKEYHPDKCCFMPGELNSIISCLETGTKTADDAFEIAIKYNLGKNVLNGLYNLCKHVEDNGAIINEGTQCSIGGDINPMTGRDFNSWKRGV